MQPKNHRVEFPCSSELKELVNTLHQTEFSDLKLASFNRLIFVFGLENIKTMLGEKDKLFLLSLLDKKS